LTLTWNVRAVLHRRLLRLAARAAQEIRWAACAFDYRRSVRRAP